MARSHSEVEPDQFGVMVK